VIRRLGRASGDQHMTKEDDYRRHAAETMELVNKATTSSDKRRLLQLVERWLNLADRAHQAARDRLASVRMHPLMRSRLEHERRDAD
jgi:hypothetical protein